jgi:hypothetical protein
MLVTTKLHTLSSEESITKYAEETERVLDQYRLSEHQQMKDSWRKRGHMHSSEFIVRVKRMNPTLFVQQQINQPNHWGFYADVRGKLTYLSAFTKGWVPEYSYILADDRDLPIDEMRGWRTCLTRLLGMGVVSWHQVCREFGDVSGNGGEKWRQMTLPYRAGNSTRLYTRNLANKLEMSK